MSAPGRFLPITKCSNRPIAGDRSQYSYRQFASAASRIVQDLPGCLHLSITLRQCLLQPPNHRYTRTIRFSLAFSAANAASVLALWLVMSTSMRSGGQKATRLSTPILL